MTEELPDIEIGRYALRTFDLAHSTLKSLAMRYTWDKGVSIAQCLRYGKDEQGCETSPNDECTCGVYGTTTLASLYEQYPAYAQKTVAVFAAEGNTIVGEKGLRTAAARIVAYWCAHGVLTPDYAQAYRDCEGAKQYTDLNEMLKQYKFPQWVGEWPPPTAPANLDDILLANGLVPPARYNQSYIVPLTQAQVDGSIKKITDQAGSAFTPAGVAAIKHALGKLT